MVKQHIILSILLIPYVVTLKLYRPSNSFIIEPFIEEEVPGIQYLSRGYNIFFGNPHTTAKIDAGIAGSIFDLLNCSNGQTYNGYLVPNGVSILPASTCVQEFKYSAISGVNSYSSTLQESAHVEAKWMKVSFSASTDYQKIYNETTKTKSIYTSTYTQCACYYASLKIPYALPTFDENFIGAVKYMPLKYDPSDDENLQYFYDFFTKYFGTHYISDITMGGIFGTLSSMDSFSYSKYESSNLDISTSAKWSTVKVSGAASSMTNSSVTQANDFDSILKSQSIFNIGGDLPTNGSAAAWQRSLSTKPMPMYYKFDTIPHLITSLNFPNIPDITEKQSALQAALDNYCNILSRNDTFGRIECSGYPPDPTLPGLSIIKGWYSNYPGGEPPNPYTNGYNCNQGYTPIVSSKYLSPGLGDYTSFYCINETMNKKDGLMYFGGFYEMCRSEYTGKKYCQIGNYFTGDCSCPQGYGQFFSRAAMAYSHIAECQSNNKYNTANVYVYMCYNQSVPLSRTILAGTYGLSSNGGHCGDNALINPYTKTHSCPDGFTAYLSGKSCCYLEPSNGFCGAVFKYYTCLNNIYPV